MHRDFSALDIERNLLLSPLHENPDLCSGTSLHAAHHAVLREFDARNIARIHFQDAVSRLESDFFGRTSGDDFQDDRRVIRDIELYADAVEVAGKLSLRFLQFHRRQINGMRVKRCQ